MNPGSFECGRKGWLSSLDGVQECVEHVLEAKMHGLEEVVIQLDG